MTAAVKTRVLSINFKCSLLFTITKINYLPVSSLCLLSKSSIFILSVSSIITFSFLLCLLSLCSLITYWGPPCCQCTSDSAARHSWGRRPDSVCYPQPHTGSAPLPAVSNRWHSCSGSHDQQSVFWSLTAPFKNIQISHLVKCIYRQQTKSDMRKLQISKYMYIF